MGDDYVRAVAPPPLRAPPSPPTYAAFVAAFLAGSVPRVALRRIYLLRLLGRRHPPSAFVAQSCPFCDAVVTDLVLHLRAACWHYLGYLVSVLGALCWHDRFRQRVLGVARPPAYWLAVPSGVLGLWDPLHPGVDTPPG